jgi:hypothetical protein
MPIQRLTLDDNATTWSQMVERIRGRIMANSGGAWTFHSPIDPGVTMLELFAWLLEQRAFWLDQPADNLASAALGLLGQQPQDAIPAGLVLGFGPVDLQCTVPPAEFEVRDSEKPLFVTTEEAITLLPLKDETSESPSIEVYVDGIRRTCELDNSELGNSGIPLTHGNDLSSELVFELRCQRPLLWSENQPPLSLLLQIQTPTKIRPEWDGTLRAQASATGASLIGSAADIRWVYQTTTGDERELPELRDGTLGFRRPGIVRLGMPKDWAPHSVDCADGVRYRIVVRISNAHFTAPPVITQLQPNVVLAWRRKQLVVSEDEPELKMAVENWLPLPGMEFDLNVLPVMRPGLLPLLNGFELWLRETNGSWQQWEPRFTMFGASAQARVFRLDRDKGILCFGDGKQGRIPRLANDGEPNVKLTFWVGGGTENPFNRKLVWLPSDTTLDLAATNVTDSLGGQDQISPDASVIKSSQEESHRAVIDKDFKTLAETTPGVAIHRAKAVPRFDAAHPCVEVPDAITVFLLPEALRVDSPDKWVKAPLADPGTLQAVQNQLEQARLIGTKIVVRSFPYFPVSVTVEVESDSQDSAKIVANIRQKLQQFLDPIKGGEDNQGWGPGTPLRPNEILERAQGALESVSLGLVVDVTIYPLSGTQPPTNCGDLEIGDNSLVELRKVKVQIRQPKTFVGGLQ